MAALSGTPLSAAEALVLLKLPRFEAAKAVKIGLMGLLAQGVVRARQETKETFFGRRRPVVHLGLSPSAPVILPPPSASLVAVVKAAEAGGGTMRALVGQAQSAYGRTLVNFVQYHVGPSLVARGLAEARETRVLWVYRLTRFHPTAAGEAERRRLEAAMQAARTIPDYLDRDPAQAAALAAAAGSAVLLVEELRPHYRGLAEAMRRRDGDNGGDAGAGFIGMTDSSGGSRFDFGSCDFGSFDGFDTCFDAFDAGFDAGGGDGGDGGNGGGDGGGSGC